MVLSRLCYLRPLHSLQGSSLAVVGNRKCRVCKPRPKAAGLDRAYQRCKCSWLNPPIKLSDPKILKIFNREPALSKLGDFESLQRAWTRSDTKWKTRTRPRQPPQSVYYPQLRARRPEPTEVQPKILLPAFFCPPRLPMWAISRRCNNQLGLHLRRHQTWRDATLSFNPLSFLFHCQDYVPQQAGASCRHMPSLMRDISTSDKDAMQCNPAIVFSLSKYRHDRLDSPLAFLGSSRCTCQLRHKPRRTVAAHPFLLGLFSSSCWLVAYYISSDLTALFLVPSSRVILSSE